MAPRAAVVTLAALVGCGRVGDDDAIVVVFSIDTMGQAMAERTGLCEDLQGLFAEYDLDLGCLRGAVSPSSWTGEAHTRVLWPQHLAGERRALQYPTCGDRSVLATIEAGAGGRHIFGADNSVLGDSGKEVCSPWRTSFTQGADARWETSEEPAEIVLVPEADRPAHAALDELERVLDGRERGVQLFLNAMEPGGHVPRCWFDPTTEACEALWDAVVEYGLAEEDADRRATWLDAEFYGRFVQLLAVRRAEDESRWRPLVWEAIAESATYHRDTMLLDRVRRVLDAARAAGRLDDVRFVAFGDHGENPCVARGLGDDTLNCGHSGIPTEFTAFVPVYVSPASLGEGWADAGLVGGGTEPWSLANVSYGLLDSVGVPVPEDWPSPEPVGSATSWICKGPDGAALSGVRVEGDEALRCRRGVCEASTFAIPDDETYTPTPLTELPASLDAWAGDPDWFTDACGG